MDPSFPWLLPVWLINNAERKGWDMKWDEMESCRTSSSSSSYTTTMNVLMYDDDYYWKRDDE